MKFRIKGMLFAALMAAAAGAQAQVQVDPGVASNNYKHPNKAKKARAQQEALEVPTLSHVEKQENAKMNHKIVTPKYAKRHATLIADKPVEGGGVKVNPMTSPDNYKAGRPVTAVRRDSVGEFASSND